jgi:L,D-transpeptidase ErfK/SrfK
VRLAAAIAALLTTVAAAARQVPSPEVTSQVVAAFEQSTRDYASLHRRLEEPIGSIRLGMSVEAINRHIEELAAAIRAERAAARGGEFFTPALAIELRARVDRALVEHGYTVADVLAHGRVPGVDYARVRLRVNDTFPWILGVAMLPCVVDAMPALPSELQYRIVGRDLVLIDVHASLVVDLLASLLVDPDMPASILVGGQFTYEVKAGDTLATIGARFGVTRASLIEMNQLKRPDVMTVGQSLVIDNTHVAAVDPRVSLTINIAQRLLVFADQDRVTAYPVTVGRRTWPTPVGAFTIVEKETNPAWDVPVSIQREMKAQGKPVITRMEASASNPLGAHWLRLSLPSLGIHGTNAPSSIYRFASHGCIRMHPDDVAELFGRVDRGTTGVLIYQPVILGIVGGRVWLEANPDEYRRAPNAFQHVRDDAERGGVTELIDWRTVDDVLRRRIGRAIDVTKPD